MSVDLRVDWCNYEAAKFAVEHWHYSRTMPVAKLVSIGAWESGAFIGCVIFSWGANPNIAKPFGLKMTECVELVRVALKNHESQTSQIVARAIKLFAAQSPGVRLLVSYADTREGHHGGIYQAMNWIYVGPTLPKFDFELDGMILQRRSYTGRNFDGTRRRVPSRAGRVVSPPKHKYLYPLDRAMRKQIELLRKPYPKHEPCGSSVEGDTLPQAESDVRSIGAASDMTGQTLVLTGENSE